MGCYAVAAMLEEPPSVACRHHVESSAHRLYERLAGTRPGPPQERLELSKRFFYGVEIGRVGRQVEKRAASLLDELAHPRTFVRREVVHHHYLPRLQFGSKDPLHIGLEDGLRGCTLHRQRRPDPREDHARQERDVRSPVARRRTKRSLTSARPGMQGRKRGVGAHLIDKDQTLGLGSRGDHDAPGCPQPLVSLTRTHRSFFRLHPMRPSILLSVESLTSTLHTVKWRRWRRQWRQGHYPKTETCCEFTFRVYYGNSQDVSGGR